MLIQPAPISPAMQGALTRWRKEALSILNDLESSDSQRRLAWRFLKTWRVARSEGGQSPDRERTVQ